MRSKGASVSGVCGPEDPAAKGVESPATRFSAGAPQGRVMASDLHAQADLPSTGLMCRKFFPRCADKVRGGGHRRLGNAVTLPRYGCCVAFA